MALNTTPEEAKAIHELGAIPAREIASKWLRNTDGYRTAKKRFRDCLKCAIDIVEAGVSVPALEVNKYLADSFGEMNWQSSQYSKIVSEIEGEILGYAIEGQDPESFLLFKEVVNH